MLSALDRRICSRDCDRTQPVTAKSAAEPVRPPPLGLMLACMDVEDRWEGGMGAKRVFHATGTARTAHSRSLS